MNQEPSKDVHHIVPDFHANHRIQVGHHLVDDNKIIANCQVSLCESERLVLQPHPLNDPTEFGSLADLHGITSKVSKYFF